VVVNGGQNIQSESVASGEANADVQYAVTMAYKVPVRYYAVGGQGPLVADLE
jgi:tripeptidyl-peptidase I